MLATSHDKSDKLDLPGLTALARSKVVWLWLAVAALTLLAFFMRRKGLATQSLWFDEADLVVRAQRDPGALLADFLRPGENGPLYTLLMHFWIKLAGTGEAALRTPSLLAGTLVVPLIFRLGQRFLGGWHVGLLTAGLVAISPYQLWYSQDAKMYPLSMLLTVASVYLFLSALENGGRLRWIAYVVLTTLSFYIHLMSILIVAVEVFYYFLYRQPESTALTPTGSIRPLNRRRAGIALGCLTLPYLPIALWQARAFWDGGIGKTWFQPVGLFDMLNTLTRRFGVNRINDPWLETLGALLYAGLVGLGLLAVWRFGKPAFMPVPLAPSAQKPVIAPTGRGRWPARFKSNNKVALLLSLYLLLPILAFYVLSTRIPLFADRYLLIASPAYYLLSAWGLLWLGRRAWPLGLITGGAALTLAVIALFNFNYAEAPQKEDWREAMHWLQGQLREGDEVLIMPGYLQTAVSYYLKPDPKIPVYALPENLIDRAHDRELNSYLTAENGILRGHERIWIIVSPERYKQENPEEYVRRVWFNYNTWTFSDPQVFLGVSIYGFTPRQIPGTDADYFPRSVSGQDRVKFGDSLLLEGYDVLPTQQPGLLLPPGQVHYDDQLHLTFYWRKLANDPTDYEMTVRLLDQNGQDTRTNYTAQPLSGYFPTGQWREGQAMRDYRDLYIHVPPGQYQVELTVQPKGQPSKLLTGFRLKDDRIDTSFPPVQKLIIKAPIIVLAK